MDMLLYELTGKTHLVWLLVYAPVFHILLVYFTEIKDLK